MDFRKFRIYLKEKYGVRKAYLFIGYLEGNQNLYKSLQEYGYVLVFKPILENSDGKVKGNVDAELVLYAMIDYKKYDQAVIITNDGDFFCLVEYFYRKNKLKKVVSPNRNSCSALLKRAAKEKIDFLDYQREKLKRKRKSTASG